MQSSTIRKISSDYPWLKNSRLWSENMECDCNDDDVFDAYVCKIDEANFRLFLRVINFWMFDNFTVEIFDSLRKFNPKDVKEAIIELPYQAKDSGKILNFVSEEDPMKTLLKFGYTDLLDYCCIKGYCTYIKASEKLAEQGFLNCIKYMHEKHLPMSNNISNHAAYSGNLELFIYLRESGYSISQNVSFVFGSRGFLNCLKYLYNNNFYIDRGICSIACMGGNLDILKFFFERGYPIDDLTCLYSVKSGSLDCLKFAFEHGAQITHESVSEACSKGFLSILEYTLQHVTEIFFNSVGNAVRSKNPEVLKCILNFYKNHGLTDHGRSLNQAASYGNLEILKILIDSGYKIEASTLKSSLSAENLDCYHYLKDLNCPYDETIYDEVIENEDLERIQFLHENGYKWNSQTFNFARNFGNEDVLNYLIEKGCPTN